MSPPFDPRTHQGRLPSPCTSVCVMQPDTGLCQGCQRSIDEIIGWSSASEDRKRAIWLTLLARRAAMPAGGASGEPQP